MPTGGTVEQRPTISKYTDQYDAATGDAQTIGFCARVGCGRLAALVWTEQSTGRVMAYCAEDGVEAFNIVTRWLGEPEQRVRLEEHKAEVERSLGRGLYGLEPNRLYRGEPGNMR